MKMEDGLPGATPGVHNRAVASAVAEPVFIRHSRRYAQEVAQQQFILLRRIIQRFQVLSGDNQQVRRGLRINVANDYASIVLIDNISRRIAGKNLTKKAISLTHGRMISQSLAFKLQLA